MSAEAAADRPSTQRPTDLLGPSTVLGRQLPDVRLGRLAVVDASEHGQQSHLADDYHVIVAWIMHAITPRQLCKIA